jgi:hypothetical protein
MPNGQAAPVDGWSEAISQVNDAASDTCASGGGLVAGLHSGHSHPADTDLATWAFNAPAGETIAAATLMRAGDTAGGGNSNDTYMFWLTGFANSGESTVLFDKCDAFKGCASEGNSAEPLAASNRVEVPEKALHSAYLSLNASCGSLISGSECNASPGDANGYAAVVELFAADLVLADEAPPTVSEVGGALAREATIAGTSDVAFHAADAGSGVFQALFKVDGATVQSTVLAGNGNRCHDVGQTSDGLAAFLYTQPCPAEASVDVPFDTTGLSDGAHHLVVSLTDAAGNATPVLDRQVTVANAAPPAGAGGGGTGGGSGGTGAGTGTGTGTGTGGGASTAAGGATPNGASPSAQPAARGAANGSEASDQATLTAAWRGSASARVTSAFAAAHTAQGRLSGPGGRPIAGAQIDVSVLPAYAGAHAAALRAPRTDANGRWRVALPRTSASATLRFAYRSHLGDATPVATRTLSLAVHAGLTLRIAPRISAVGHTIRFNGRLRGGPIPAGGKQLVLEARSPGSAWIEFDAIRTDAAGRFHASYRFHLPGPVRYSFRVLCGYEADYPYLAGASRVVGVWER